MGGIRKQALSTGQLFSELYAAVNALRDVVKRRALPAGYEFKVVDGLLTIVRTADGATQTLDI